MTASADNLPPEPPRPSTVRVFTVPGSRGQGLTLYRLRCRPGEDLCTIHEALADGSLYDWTGAIRGVHQAEAAVRAGGAG